MVDRGKNPDEDAVTLLVREHFGGPLADLKRGYLRSYYPDVVGSDVIEPVVDVVETSAVAVREVMLTAEELTAGFIEQINLILSVFGRKYCDWDSLDNALKLIDAVDLRNVDIVREVLSGLQKSNLEYKKDSCVELASEFLKLLKDEELWGCLSWKVVIMSKPYQENLILLYNYGEKLLTLRTMNDRLPGLGDFLETHVLRNPEYGLPAKLEVARGVIKTLIGFGLAVDDLVQLLNVFRVDGGLDVLIHYRLGSKDCHRVIKNVLHGKGDN